MTAQFQFFQSLPHKKADFVKKKPAEHGVYTSRNKVIPAQCKYPSSLTLSARTRNPFIKKKWLDYSKCCMIIKISIVFL